MAATGAGVTTALVVFGSLHSAAVVHTSWLKSPSLDEVAHLAAGLSHAEFGTFDLYRVNPPLPRLPAGIALELAGAKMSWSEYHVGAVDRREFSNGANLAHLNADRYRGLVFLARLTCLPWTLLAFVCCYLFGRDVYGRSAGLLAAGLWAVCPETIAHASMVTPDVAGAAFGLLASYAYYRWLRQPGWGTALTPGLSLGFALLAKFTWIILPVLWPLMAFACFWRSPTKTAAAQLCGMMIIGWGMLHAGYGFEAPFRPLGEFEFRSEALGGTAARGYGKIGNRFRGTALEGLPVPVPRNVLLGLDVQKDDFERGLRSYLAGTWQDHGWWYYYIYAAAVKLPLGVWLLGTFAILRGRFRRREAAVVVPGVMLFAFVSSQDGFSHHFRYVLPALPFCSVFIGRLVGGPAAVTARTGRAVVCGAFLWVAAAGMLIHPHHLSYFNEAAGGPRKGHAHLVDSNIDWGQDLWLLEEWLDENRSGRPLGLAYFGGFLEPARFGVEYELPPRFNPKRSGDPGPQPGLYALSINFLRGRTQFTAPDGHGGDVYVWDPCWTYFLTHFKPAATAGYSIYIYDLKVDEVNRVRHHLGLPPIAE